MPPIRPTRSLSALLTAVFLAAAMPAGAQQARKADLVAEVRVIGNTFRSDAAVLADVTIRPNQPFDQAAVRRDEQRLLKTRRYARVRATATRTERGVIVTFEVTERPTIDGVFFRGNKAFKDGDLAKALTVGRGDAIDLFLIESGRQAIASLYRAAGFYRVNVTYDEIALEQNNQVIYRIVEGPKAYIKKICFRGNAGIGAFQLRTVVKSKRRIWPFTAGALDLETADRDVVDLRNFYRSKGYLDTQVGHELTADGKAVTLTFLIEEGPRYRVRCNVFQGATVFSHAQLQRDLKLAPTTYYDEKALREDRRHLRNIYGEIGYIEMAESVRPTYTDQAGLVDVVYTIREGGQYRVGRIDIRGNTVTHENVIRRQLQYRPSQLYNAAAVQESAQRLRETQLFENVEITPFGDRPGVRNSLVRITEGQTGRFLIGAGLSSNRGLLGSIRFTEHNFNPLAWPRSWEQVRNRQGFRGAGQLLRISAEPGTEDMRFRVDWEEPWLFDKPILLGTSAYAFSAVRQGYDENRLGGLLRVGHRFPNRWYVAGALRVVTINLDNIDLIKAQADLLRDAGTSSLVGIKGTLIRDRTDSRWLPSRGDRISLSFEQIVGDYQFGRTIADYRRYWTLATDEQERKHILAMRGFMGNIVGTAPLFETFYGGGLGSIRGFRWRRVSPRQGAYHQVVGGNFSMLLNGEYTFPVVGNQLRGVVFLDSGTVERTATIKDYRVSVGVGVMIYMWRVSPIPLGFYLGFPLAKKAVDDTQLVSFSIGWAF